MAGGDAFNRLQLIELERAVERAEARSGLAFSLFVGPLPQGRASAEALHAASGPDPSSRVLVAVDPGGRTLQIVTGSRAALQCDARSCGLAAAAMTTSFGAGDLLGGIRNGLELLGEHAYRPELLHTSTL